MQKKKILIFGNQLSGHNNPIFEILSSFIDLNYDIDFCITDDFKERVAKYPVNFIFYPPEVLTIFRGIISEQKEMKNLDDDRFLNARYAFEMQAAITKVIVPWALKTLKPQDYKFVIYSSFSIWSNCLAVHWKLPQINSTASFKVPKFLFNKLEDEETKVLVDDFNKEFGTKWTTVTDMLSCDNAERIILYTSEYFHYHNQTIPKEKIFFTPRSKNTQFFTGRKKMEPGSLIYFSLGTVFNRDTNLLRNAMHTLGKFKQYKVLYSFGKAKDLYEEIKKENVYENIEMVEWADQQKILQSTCLFITHAGFSSVREAAQTATPMILCPQCVDQPDVANRVCELKAGLVIKKNRKDDDLEKAISEIANNYDSFVDGVKRIQDSYMNSLDGEGLVHAIEGYLKI